MIILQILVLVVLLLMLIGVLIALVGSLFRTVKKCIDYGWDSANVAYIISTAAFALLLVLTPFLLFLKP